MTYSSKTPCPDRVLPSTTVWFFQRETKQSLHTPHFTLHSSHSKLQTSHSTLHTSHCTLRTPNFKLHTPHFTLHTSHCALRTPNWNFTLHTSHSTLNTSHFSLLTASFTLQTSHFTLHSLHPTLPTALNLRATKKTLVPKWRKSANKSISQPSCSHSKTISEIQLQKTIVLPMQPQHEATLTQPLQCDLQRLSCKTQ